MNVTKQVLDLAQLYIGWLENFGWTSKVILNSYTKNLECHHYFDILLGAFIFVSSLEFGNCIVVLISKFPPVGAELTDNSSVVGFKSSRESN